MSVHAAYILLTVGCIYLAAGVIRLAQRGRGNIQARTWLVVAAILMGVGLWLARFAAT